MERESFIFYRSFYEAIRDLPDAIRLEVFTAITEYALYGKQPEDLKPFARGMFTIIKPNLDANIKRYENGRKGGRKPKNPVPDPSPELLSQCERDSAMPRTTAPDVPSPSEAVRARQREATSPDTPFRQEADHMLADTIWTEPVCMQFHIDLHELSRRLDQFVTHCQIERGTQPHTSHTDARRHFTSWMRKAYQPQNTPDNDPTPQDKYTKRRGADSAAVRPEDYTGEI